MSDESKYRVLPREVEMQKPNLQPIPNIDSMPLTDSEKSEMEGLSCVTVFIPWLLIFIVVGVAVQSDEAGLVVASISIVIIAFARRVKKVAELEQKKAEETKRSIEYANQNEMRRIQNEKRRIDDEAALLTSSLTKMYESSTSLVTELSQNLNQASILLQRGEEEFKDNAFSPFWDAVENAAKQLAICNDRIKQLSSNGAEYYRKLEGRNHTFPAFPIDNKTIPDPSPVLNQLRRIVRMGQTNIHFAQIWEHRMTREVLIAGFRTLGEGVNNLGATIEHSISNLERSFSSDVARLVQEEIKSRETLDRRLREQNRMLDNIQHHRKPE